MWSSVNTQGSSEGDIGIMKSTIYVLPKSKEDDNTLRILS